VPHAKSETDGAVDEDGEQVFTRPDFSDAEQYAGFLRRSGEFPRDEEGQPMWTLIEGSGTEVRMHQAVFGMTKRQYQNTWEGQGATSHIRLAYYAKGYYAVTVANFQALVLKFWTIITWSTGGMTEYFRVTKVNRAFFELMRKWLHERKLPKA
jgi:hypothetical protein